MAEILIPAKKFFRLFDYLEMIGLDVKQVAERAGLNYHKVREQEPDKDLPGKYYSRLYKQAVVQMETLKQPIPWAAGIGSTAFEMMCHCIIGCKTLGEALARAQRFDHLLYPMIGYRMKLVIEGDTAKIDYAIAARGEENVLSPVSWDRSVHEETVAKASGLAIWYAFSGWLIGRTLEPTEVKVSAPYLNEAYYEGLSNVFHCPIVFDADENTVSFSREYLDFRLVHNAESLNDFLENSIYHLMAMESRPVSTSAAIKSLISADIQGGMPAFASIASALHMSESSLRRRLVKEGSSYQQLKDEVRCALAIEYLLNNKMKIADIAEILGFTEPSSFVRSFRAWTGATPKMYREKIEALH
ncbi:MAG: AraC family transcriptional regulator ligand-binding domain-containing protein [Pseudomonadales bacterium]